MSGRYFIVSADVSALTVVSICALSTPCTTAGMSLGTADLSGVDAAGAAPPPLEALTLTSGMTVADWAKAVVEAAAKQSASVLTPREKRKLDMKRNS